MRRIAEPAGAERGSTAVVVALLMVVLLGFAAISIDVAKLYSERAQLQNGADAAALMVAHKCAKNEADPDCSAGSPMAAELADKNAVDGLSNIKSIALDKPGRTVQVTAGAKEAGAAPNNVTMFFAGVLGFPSAEVSARSKVIWGSPVKGPVPFPLTFSVCQVSGMVDGATQLLQHHASSAHSSCSLGPGGATVPGGFGWVAQPLGQCSVSVDLATNQAGSAVGNDGPSYCNETLNGWAADLAAGKKVVVLFPVFDDAIGGGSNASYHLTSFAAISVEGWKFGGTEALPLVFRNMTNPDRRLRCEESCRGIIGKFIKYVSLSDAFKLGPLNSSGATLVKITG